MAHKRKLGLPILFGAVVAIGAAFAVASSSPAFSWEGRLPSDFALKGRNLTSPLKVAWSHWESYGVSTWNYESPFDPEETERRLKPLVAGWGRVTPMHGYGFEREPGGPFLLLEAEGSRTRVILGGERVRPTLLTSWLAKLPLDKLGMMPSRITKVWIVRHGSPYPIRRSTKSTGVSSGRPSLRPLPPVTKPTVRRKEPAPRAPAQAARPRQTPNGLRLREASPRSL